MCSHSWVSIAYAIIRYHFNLLVGEAIIRPRTLPHPIAADVEIGYTGTTRLKMENGDPVTISVKGRQDIQQRTQARNSRVE
jgi:hypothetical protein